MPAVDFPTALAKTSRRFLQLLPIVVGMLLVTSLAMAAIPPDAISRLFGHSDVLDVLVASGAGGIAAGHPLASYVLGGELQNAGISLMAITALIVSWVTVGVVQLPAEALLLGKRFALTRNAVALGLSMILALLVPWTLTLVL